MKTVKEIADFLLSTDPGKPLFKIVPGYSGGLHIVATIWSDKEALANHSNWLVRENASNISRYLNRDDKKLYVSGTNLEHAIREKIVTTFDEMAYNTNPADQPKRTNSYKDIKEIAYINRHDDNFVNEILPIVEYYISIKGLDKTSSKVHFTNIQALLGILRKKYGPKKKM